MYHRERPDPVINACALAIVLIATITVMLTLALLPSVNTKNPYDLAAMLLSLVTSTGLLIGGIVAYNRER